MNENLKPLFDVLIIIAVIGLVLFFIIALAAAVFVAGYLMYSRVFGKRCDGNERLKYFTHNDFEGLKAAPVEFPNNKGITLRGAIYAKAGLQAPKGLIVFSHGMGGGHLSYMTEINTFAQNGYAVLAYDNTGTFSSDGKKIGSFCQGPEDLKAALKFVKAHPVLGKMETVLAGHSWGGYSVCRALGDEEVKVDGAVTFGAPNSGYQVISAAMGPKLAFLQPVFKLFFLLFEGKSAMELCSDALAKAEPTPVLLLQGEEDAIVKASISAALAAQDLPHVKAVFFEGRYHNVYQTVASEEYMNDTFANINALKKNKNATESELNDCYDNIDYELMTREDPAVINLVLQFMDNCTK